MIETEVISAFRKFLDNSSAPPSGHVDIQADGERHRYHVEGDRAGTKNGTYCLYTDGLPAGWCMSWKNGTAEDKEIWTCELTDDERRKYAQRQNNPVLKAQSDAEKQAREQRRAEALRQQKEDEAQARLMALAEYKAASPITPLEHAYLKAKFDGIDIACVDDGQFETRYNGDYTEILNWPPVLCTGTIEGGRCKAGELLIPTRNIATGRFNSLIRIPSKPDSSGHWPKWYYKGVSPTGAAYIIRPQHARLDAVYLCEGFSTAIAAMISLKSKFIVMAAGSCNNLKPVCTSLKQRTPKTKIIIIADNDDAGIKAANECIKAGVADTYIKPEISGQDWCDDLVARLKRSKNNVR